MTNLTAEEAKSRYIKKMGRALGAQFAALWQEVVWLRVKWSEFVELYGTKPTRIELLNRAAPAFFAMTQRLLWEDVLLHIARLTDASKSPGRNIRKNLSIQNLPELVNEITQKKKVAALGPVDIRVKMTGFCGAPEGATD